jgi:mannose-6-phosphate isomerase-like protein (cupin superfamily)
MDKVNLAEKFSRIADYWSPKIAGEINDSYVKLVKVKGEFVWHHHDNEDELFLISKGTLRMKLRDPDEREVALGPGEFIVIPRGVEHCPVADDEVHLLLFEPKSTLNTGNVTSDRTLPQLERI